jgi:hypothetical protein
LIAKTFINPFRILDSFLKSLHVETVFLKILEVQLFADNARPMQLLLVLSLAIWYQELEIFFTQLHNQQKTLFCLLHTNRSH